MTGKMILTPAEFAALFGRERTWTYRLLYAGKIHGISDFGCMMIPATEAARIEGTATRYLGRKRKGRAIENPKGKPRKPSGGKRTSTETPPEPARETSPTNHSSAEQSIELEEACRKLIELAVLWLRNDGLRLHIDLRITLAE